MAPVTFDQKLAKPGIISGYVPKAGRWKIFLCPKTNKQIGYWTYDGVYDHKNDICPRCGGLHYA